MSPRTVRPFARITAGQTNAEEHEHVDHDGQRRYSEDRSSRDAGGAGRIEYDRAEESSRGWRENSCRRVDGRIQRDGARHRLAAHEVREHRLPRRPLECAYRREPEPSGDDVPCGEQSQYAQHGQRAQHEDEEHLHRDEQSSLVELIGERAAEQRERRRGDELHRAVHAEQQRGAG